VPSLAPKVDLVVARENTVGFYADRNMEKGNADILVTTDVAITIGIANPFSLVLSVGLLLDWHGRRTGAQRFLAAAEAIDRGVADAVASGEATRDVGGGLGTRATGAALAARVRG
jgi:isocitrate/isopropylmalate dehydrogenase